MKKPNAGTVVVASLIASTIGTMVLYFKSDKEYLEETKERNETIEKALKQTEEAIEGWKVMKRDLKVSNLITKARGEEILKNLSKAREALGVPGINLEEGVNTANIWLNTIEVIAKNMVE